jgi:nitric oxide dioxygenase
MLARPPIRNALSSLARNRAFHSTPRRFELSARQIEIVKSTAPVLADRGIDITTHFYKRMLDAHPELKNIFNTAHQATGAQPAALAHSIWAYASNIDNLGALDQAVSRIGNKHASLNVSPEQYPIVGEHLLASIQEILGDAVNGEVLDAWKEAYQQLANIFITFEKGLYNKAESTPGGWTGWRKFAVAKKVNESDEIISFHLVPTDKGQLPTFESGQFISVRKFIPELGVHQPRQYSLSDAPAGTHFRISVKKEPETRKGPAGVISNVLHQHLPEGEEIEVSNPYGDFTLDIDADTPVVLISGGVGLTPMMSMLSNIVQHGRNRPVVFVHAVRNGKVHAMKEYLAYVIKENPQVSRAIFYEDVDPGDRQGVDYDYQGRIELEKIKDQVILPDADYYLCGPVVFMQIEQKALEALGVPKERIHSEVFGAGTA